MFSLRISVLLSFSFSIYNMLQLAIYLTILSPMATFKIRHCMPRLCRQTQLTHTLSIFLHDYSICVASRVPMEDRSSSQGNIGNPVPVSGSVRSSQKNRGGLFGDKGWAVQSLSRDCSNTHNKGGYWTVGEFWQWNNPEMHSKRIILTNTVYLSVRPKWDFVSENKMIQKGQFS